MTIQVHAKEDLLADLAAAEATLRARLGRDPSTSDVSSHFGMLFAVHIGAVASVSGDPLAVIESHIAVARASARAVCDEARHGRRLQ